MPRKAKIITAVVAEGVERKYLDQDGLAHLVKKE